MFHKNVVHGCQKLIRRAISDISEYWDSTMTPLLLSLLLLAHPSSSTGNTAIPCPDFYSPETAHGCTIEKDKLADGIGVAVTAAENATQCAHVCSLDIQCEKFEFESNSKKCSLKRDSDMNPSLLILYQGRTSGFCPKGKAV